MELLGIVLMVVSAALAAFTGNVLPDSRRIRSRFEGLRNRSDLNEKEKAELNYYKINRIIFFASWTAFVIGLVLVAVSKLGGLK